MRMVRLGVVVMRRVLSLGRMITMLVRFLCSEAMGRVEIFVENLGIRTRLEYQEVASSSLDALCTLYSVALSLATKINLIAYPCKKDLKLSDLGLRPRRSPNFIQSPIFSPRASNSPPKQ